MTPLPFTLPLLPMTLQPSSCAGLLCVGVHQWRVRAIGRTSAGRMCSAGGVYVGARLMMVVGFTCVTQLLSQDDDDGVYGASVRLIPSMVRP
jgi:hypothetical protein